MSGDDGNYGASRQPEHPTPGTVTAGAQFGPPPGRDPIDDAAERALPHHFRCQRRTPLRSALVPGAVSYLCNDCGQRVSIGPDGQPVGPKVPAMPPMTDRAREAIAKLPAVLADLKSRQVRVTKTAVATGLDNADRKTLNAWIANGWLAWPPTG